MDRLVGNRIWWSRLALGLSLATLTGCASTALQHEVAHATYSDLPRELQKVSHPLYRVEPPDILLIEAVNAVRPSHTVLRTGDVLFVSLANPEPLEPIAPDVNPIEAQYQTELQARSKLIDAEYVVQPSGAVDLGPVYGEVPVAGLTVAQAEQAIRNHLTAYAVDEQGQPTGILNPLVTVTLPNLAAPQAIQGEHLVRPDGTVALGIYGAVHVAGRTMPEIRACIESHLSRFVQDPDISVDVLAYNSKVVYVITDGGGYGEQVARLPVTGNETVLDAVSQIQGLSQVSSKRIWVARPAPAGTECAQVLDVRWKEITQEGITDTNYQLFPGDRIYIQADHMITFDNFLAKTLAPFERILGVTLLTNGTVRALEGQQGSGGGFGGGF
ncbi:MAG: polysaccharide biosynthesis/export family protein [Planctomycetaceae bacterium]